MKHWGQGYDARGNGADSALDYLCKRQPPYIFGSPKIVSVGDTFMIKEHAFQVVRMIDKSNYTGAYAQDCICFFEAVTD
jgi:hypothetical protein